MTSREAVERLIKGLDPGDLQLLTSDNLFQRYSFNGRERHCLFVNARGQGFIEAGYSLGVDVDFEGRGVAVGDFDQDGALDLVVRNVARKKVVYFHNELSRKAHFFRLELVGSRSNRDAVGAVARVAAGGLLQSRVRTSGSGFQGQSEGALHFGLGNAARVETLTIEWPSGIEERFTNLPADHLVRIVEGEGRVEVRR